MGEESFRLNIFKPKLFVFRVVGLFFPLFFSKNWKNIAPSSGIIGTLKSYEVHRFYSIPNHISVSL